MMGLGEVSQMLGGGPQFPASPPRGPLRTGHSVQSRGAGSEVGRGKRTKGSPCHELLSSLQFHFTVHFRLPPRRSLQNLQQVSTLSPVLGTWTAPVSAGGHVSLPGEGLQAVFALFAFRLVQALVWGVRGKHRPRMFSATI